MVQIKAERDATVVHIYQQTNLILPSLQAIRVNINPLYLMIPATVSASLAFVLPVAHPSNAIAFSYGVIKVYEMVSLAALWISILCTPLKEIIPVKSDDLSIDAPTWLFIY